MSETIEERVIDLLDRIQPYLRHIPNVTHTEIEELRGMIALRRSYDGGCGDPDCEMCKADAHAAIRAYSTGEL